MALGSRLINAGKCLSEHTATMTLLGFNFFQPVLVSVLFPPRPIHCVNLFLKKRSKFKVCSLSIGTVFYSNRTENCAQTHFSWGQDCDRNMAWTAASDLDTTLYQVRKEKSRLTMLKQVRSFLCI